MKRCIARVLPNTYRRDPKRCEKKITRVVVGLDLCRHHERVAARGGLEVWTPALEKGR